MDNNDNNNNDNNNDNDNDNNYPHLIFFEITLGLGVNFTFALDNINPHLIFLEMNSRDKGEYIHKNIQNTIQTQFF